MNFEVINKIKTVSLFFALSLVALISTFVIYQTLDINGDNLKNEAKNLEERLNTLIKEKKFPLILNLKLLLVYDKLVSS